MWRFAMLVCLVCIHGCGGDGSTPAADAGPSPDAEVQAEDPCVAGADLFVTGRVVDIDLTLSTGDWVAMIDEAEASPEYGGPPKVYYRGQLRIDGTDIGEVGLRLKGHYSLLTALGRSYPLKIDPDRFTQGLRIDGLKKLNLHPTGEATSVLREHLSYGALRDLGIPTARTAFARVTVNGDDLGLYSAVEQINGRFIKCHFPAPHGQLYKPEEISGPLADRGPDIGDYPDINHKWPDEPDHAPLLAMIATINSGDLADFGDVVDIDGVLTYLAANVAVGNFDYYMSFGHNYYLYEVEPGRFTMLPWDMNLSQQPLWHPCYPGRNTDQWPLSHRLLADPAHVSRYAEILGGMLSSEASRLALESRLDAALEIVGDEVPSDVPDELRGSIEFRVSQIEGRLPGFDACPEFVE